MRILCKMLILAGMLLQLVQPVYAAAETVPTVAVNVLEIGRNSGSISIDQKHTWYIRCFFPRQEEGQHYTVLQTLSPWLTYEPGSLEAVLLSGDSREIRLSMEEHYLFTAGSVFVEEGTADRISVSLTEAGRALLFPGAELRISYRAVLKKTVPMGTQLLGTAQLSCQDRDGNRRVSLANKAAVSTGGFHIRLTDTSGDPIPGGKFMVAREAGEEAKNTIVEILDTEEGMLPVVYVPFLNGSGEKAYITETDLEGNALCCGLAYGEYYLVQTELPEGAGLPAPPVKVTVNEVSHLTLADGWKDSAGAIADHTVRIVAGSLIMPQTGGPGTRGYTVSGMLVILSACLLLWFNRKGRITV